MCKRLGCLGSADHTYRRGPGEPLMQQSRSGSSAVGPQKNCVWDQRSGVLLLAALLLCHSVLADGGLPGHTQSVAATETRGAKRPSWACGNCRQHRVGVGAGSLSRLGPRAAGMNGRSWKAVGVGTVYSSDSGVLPVPTATWSTLEEEKCCPSPTLGVKMSGGWHEKQSAARCHDSQDAHDMPSDLA